MKTIEEILQNPNLRVKKLKRDDANDHFTGIGTVKFAGFYGSVIFVHNEKWLMDHVSVSNKNPKRLPSWDEMCKLKDVFFGPDEMVVQIHPAEKNYFHGFESLPNVLHLWRPVSGDFSLLNEPERWQ